MKNTAKKLLGICMITVFTFSCSNEKTGHDTTLEIEDENRIINNDEESSSTRNLNEFGNDTLSNREGVAINDGMENMEMQLPKRILDAIAKDSKLANAMIVQKIKREESGQTVYEVSFQPVNGKQESVVFDINGQRKQK